MRYFRSQSVEIYETVRQSLDAVYGYPNAETKTLTAIPLASQQQKDSLGRVYFVASDAECAYLAIAELLPQMLASGAAEEIQSEEYLQECPPPRLQ